MSEEEKETLSEQPESSESEQTLDDLYKDFEPRSQETPPPQSTQQPQSDQQDTSSYFDVPDPVTDQEGYKRFVQNQYKEMAALKSEVHETKSALEKEKQELATRAEERDFNDFSDRIAKSAGVDSRDVKGDLLLRFFEDNNFKNIWSNRSSNPAAFQKVEAVLANQMKGRFASRVDSQLAENQRAVEESNKSASTDKQEEQSLEDKVAKMSPQEFAQYSRQIRMG